MSRTLPIVLSLGLLACAEEPAGEPAGELDPTSSPLLGSLDKELIDDVIFQELGAIQYCYQRELNLDETLEGKLVTKFVIGVDGLVDSAEITYDQLDRPEVGDCVLDRIEELEFPPPKGGGIVIVSYPFQFSPG